MTRLPLSPGAQQLPSSFSCIAFIDLNLNRKTCGVVYAWCSICSVLVVPAPGPMTDRPYVGASSCQLMRPPLLHHKGVTRALSVKEKQNNKTKIKQTRRDTWISAQGSVVHYESYFSAVNFLPLPLPLLRSSVSLPKLTFPS